MPRQEHIAAWRQVNPDVVLSKYIPYTRDPGCPQLSGKDGPQCSSVTPGFKPGCPTCLPWWQANKPDLVLYQCDKKTPAWECFSGEGCRHESVPLDLTNPKTLEYQMSSAVHPAADAGYNAIALDNYGLENECVQPATHRGDWPQIQSPPPRARWKACGSFSGPGGAWVQKYSAANPRADKQYTKDVLDWTKRASAAIHSAGLLVCAVAGEGSASFLPCSVLVVCCIRSLLSHCLHVSTRRPQHGVPPTTQVIPNYSADTLDENAMAVIPPLPHTHTHPHSPLHTRTYTHQHISPASAIATHAHTRTHTPIANRTPSNEHRRDPSLRFEYRWILHRKPIAAHGADRPTGL